MKKILGVLFLGVFVLNGCVSKQIRNLDETYTAAYASFVMDVEMTGNDYLDDQINEWPKKAIAEYYKNALQNKLKNVVPFTILDENIVKNIDLKKKKPKVLGFLDKFKASSEENPHEAKAITKSFEFNKVLYKELFPWDTKFAYVFPDNYNTALAPDSSHQILAIFEERPDIDLLIISKMRIVIRSTKSGTSGFLAKLAKEHLNWRVLKPFVLINVAIINKRGKKSYSTIIEEYNAGVPELGVGEKGVVFNTLFYQSIDSAIDNVVNDIDKKFATYGK
ncbi:hypothetical protein ACFL4A_03575 [bacterium]